MAQTGINTLLHFRNMEAICRQRAAYRPQESWKWLAEAEMWQHRAFDHMQGRRDGHTAAEFGASSAGATSTIATSTMAASTIAASNIAASRVQSPRRPGPRS